MVELGLGSTSGLRDPEVTLEAPEDMGAAPLPATIGRYRILRLIGEGGMGAVYEAEQEHPRRTVALKIIKPGMATPESIRRFEQESHALGRLQHPGIAQIYEAGTANTGFGPQPYFAMELIHGRTPRDYVWEHSLSVRERLELVAKIADAVHHAHQRGLIHRDLKPTNILVDETGQPKVLDFGVVRVTDSETQATIQTDMGQLVGTIAYMSPEQVLGDPPDIDIRTDVFALGIILYELLAGRRPYNTARKLHEAIRAIQEEEPVQLSVVDRRYRGDIETIAVKALEKDRARRYTSAAELAADIRRYLRDEPIVARPPSPSYQLRKFARRHRAVVIGITAVFAVLIAGIVVSTWQANRARRAERVALLERDRALQAESKTSLERDRATEAEETARRQRDLARVALQHAVSAEEQVRLDRDTLLWQSLARQSVRDSDSGVDGDRAALLARQAMLFHIRTANQPQFLVEAALQKATRGDTWNHVVFRGTAPVTCVAISPSGMRLAAGDGDSFVRLWDLRYPSAKPLLFRNRRWATSVAFSRDESSLAAADQDGTVLVWDLRNPTVPPIPLQGRWRWPTARSVLSIAFSHDGASLATGGEDETVRVWDLRRPDSQPVLLQGHEAAVRSVAFLPDGTRLASASADGTVRVWNLLNPDVSPTVLLNHETAVTLSRVIGVAFSPDGARLASVSANSTIRVWDMSNLSASPTLFRLPASLEAIAFSPDGTRLASGSVDKTARIWDLHNPEAQPMLLEGHQGRVSFVSFSSDGTILASGSTDNSVRVWDLGNHDLPILLSPATFVPPPSSTPRLPSFPLAFSPDGTRLGSGGNDPNVRVWDLRNPTVPPTLFRGQKGAVLSVAFSPDGTRLASGGADTDVRVWDLRNPTVPPALFRGHEGAVLSVAFSRDGARLASASSDSTVRLWDPRNPSASTVLLKSQDPFTSAVFSPDLARLASIEQISTVRVWDLRRTTPAPDPLFDGRFWRTQRPPFNPIAGGWVTSLAISSDGARLASGGQEPSVRLWNLRNPLEAPLSPYQWRGQGRSSALVFSPDSVRLAFSVDDSVQLWDLRNPGEPPIVLPGQGLSSSDSLAFSPNGTLLASLERRTGRIVLWRLWSEAADYLCTRVWRNLSMDEWRLYVGENIPYERTCPSLPPGTGFAK
jgi:WD40 repeat protein